MLGAVLRVGALTYFTGAIDTEAAEYARIAENLLAGNGYRGIVTPGVELMFPPLYPLLIAATAAAVKDADVAARIVCLIFGSLLPLAMYGVASRLYDRNTSLWVAAAGAFHPLLVSISAWTYSEALYITLVIVGLYLVMGCMRNERASQFVFAGIAFGAAYLTRPEGFILPFVGGLFIAVAQWKTIRMVAPRIGILIGTFLTIAAPYVVFVSHHSGEFRLEGKTPINFEMTRRVLNGEDYLEVVYGVGANLEGTGIWMRSNSDVIRTAKLSSRDLGRIMLKAGKNFGKVIEMLCRAPFGTPLLLFLAVLGLFGRPWTGETRGMQLLLISVVGVTAASLLTTIFADNSRYAWFYVPVLLIWAVRGGQYLGEWTIATIDGGGRWADAERWICPAVGPACLVVMFAASAMTVDDPVSGRGRESLPTKVAGLWLRRNRAGPVTVMDSQTNLAFHAGAEFVYIPNGSGEIILSYADAKKVDFIVIRPAHPWVVGRKVLEEWGRKGLEHPRAELVYASRGSPSQELFIYRWKPQSRDEAAGGKGS